jgi:hypothetical protein
MLRQWSMVSSDGLQEDLRSCERRKERFSYWNGQGSPNGRYEGILIRRDHYRSHAKRSYSDAKRSPSSAQRNVLMRISLQDRTNDISPSDNHPCVCPGRHRISSLRCSSQFDLDGRLNGWGICPPGAEREHTEMASVTDVRRTPTSDCLNYMTE